MEILDKMNDQGGAFVLREILFNPENRIDWENIEVTLFKSICQNYKCLANLCNYREIMKDCFRKAGEML